MPATFRPPTRTLLQWSKRRRPGRALVLNLLVAALLLSACEGSPAAYLQLIGLNYPANEAVEGPSQAPAEASESAEVAPATLTPWPSLTPFQPIAPIALRPANNSTTASAPTASSTPPRATRTIPSPTNTQPAPTSTLPGHAAADFDLAALNVAGVEKISLGSLQGKPVVLTFFATWCVNCRQEIPLLISAYAEYKDRIQFIAIDLGESSSKVEKFIQTMHIPYPVLLDQGRVTERSYQIRGIPTTYFLDANGRVVDRYLGELTQKTLQQRLKKLIGN